MVVKKNIDHNNNTQNNIRNSNFADADDDGDDDDDDEAFHLPTLRQKTPSPNPLQQ